MEFQTGWKQLELDRAAAALAVAEARMNAALDDLARLEELQSRDVASEATLNYARFAAETVRAEYEVRAVEHAMANALLKAQKHFAPFDGQVSKPRFGENAYVDVAEGNEIATVVQLDPIHVEVPTSYDRLLLRLREGISEVELYERVEVLLELPDGTIYEQPGRILTSAHELEPESDTYTVLVESPNPQRILRPGLSVSVSAFERR